MQNKNLFEVWNVLSNLKFDKANAKFVYAISKNKRIVLPYIKKFEEARALSPEYQVYDMRRIAICQDFAKKDDEGNFINDGDKFIIPEDKQEEFDKALIVLKEENKKAFEIEQQKADEYEKFMNEEVEVEFWTVNADFVPDTMTVEEMDILADKIITV